jgi:hypothetical protein
MMRPYRLAALVLTAVVVACDDSKDPFSVDAGPATRIVALEGTNQSGVMGQATSVKPTVLVLDANNLPVAGAQVSFAIQSGGGTLSQTHVTSGATGEAAVTWTLGPGFANKVLEASLGNLNPVLFRASAIAPDSGIASFTLIDPANDTLVSSASGMPLAHDLLSVASRFKRDSVIFTLTFNRPVTDALGGLATAMGGAIEIDIDDDADTGDESLANFFGATANVGVDYAVSFFEASSTVAILYDLTDPFNPQFFEIPATFSGKVVTARVPVAMLGHDDGNYTAVGIVGTWDRPTDIAPNSGAVLARTGPALGPQQAASLPARATDLIRPAPKWGKGALGARQ